MDLVFKLSSFVFDPGFGRQQQVIYVALYSCFWKLIFFTVQKSKYLNEGKLLQQFECDLIVIAKELKLRW